jgi:hypothetical protein
MRICFLVGSVDISGGTYVIFQHAAYLQANGQEVTIAVQNPFTEDMLAWHPLHRCLKILPFEEAQAAAFDLVIATWWKTALELHQFQGRKYGYFVQSIESRFYQQNEIPLRDLVESTYALPVAVVTESTWIQDFLRERYGKKAVLVKNGIRKDLYRPDGVLAESKLKAGRLRVLVEGPFGVFFKNTGRTLNIVRQAQPDEIWLLTSTPVNWLPGVDRIFSRVPITKVPEIYRACDVLVKLSYVEGMFGPPLEMFHCGGTAITYNVTGHDEYIVHEVNALVAEAGDEAQVVKFLQDLKKNPRTLQQLKSSAMATAESWPDWNRSSEDFLRWVQEVCGSQDEPDRERIEAMNAQAWKKYIHEESERVRLNPWVKIKYRLQTWFDRLPPRIRGRLFWLSLVSECYL